MVLSKKYRITARGDFTGVFKGTMRARSGPFLFMCRKNDLSYSRFGFVVSLAVSKKAVVRNKLRRKLHEIVRSLFSFLPSGYDCVIRAYPGAEILVFHEIKQHLVTLFRKGNLL
ncbi:MAG: ribonuclease P protein component [Patescibacteria group bacterium]